MLDSPLTDSQNSTSASVGSVAPGGTTREATHHATERACLSRARLRQMPTISSARSSAITFWLGE